jgi:uncharacterized protein
MVSEAHVQTAKAAIYMKQLCRHFGHKLTTEWTDEDGRIEFPFGVCELRASGDVLVLRVSGEGEDIERLEGVVASHLGRFAHADELTVSWTAVAADSGAS